jgi:lysophospholipase L1-like esterase
MDGEAPQMAMIGMFSPAPPKDSHILICSFSWTDLLSAKLGTSHSTSQISVGNQGLGGNCVLSECLGPNAISRVDRDVIAQSGISYALIFEGINDIGGGDASPANQKLVGDGLIAAHQQFITRVHAAGILAFGATITPFGGSFYDEATGERQKTKTRVNEWMRKSVGGRGVGFDAVIDFDKILRDPKNVTALRKEYDTGDGLHPNTVAYAALIKEFPLNIFRN